MTFVEGVGEGADAIVYTFCPFFNMGTNHMARAKRAKFAKFWFVPFGLLVVG